MPQWSPVRKTGKTPCPECGQPMSERPQWSPVRKTGKTTRSPCRRSPTTCRNGARSGRPGRHELDPLTGRRLKSPQWSPVRKTGKTCRPGPFASVSRGRNGARSGRPGRHELDPLTGRRLKSPQWSPVRKTGKTPVQPDQLPRNGLAAMEPGQEDREDPVGRPPPTRTRPCRNGARSGRPGRPGESREMIAHRTGRNGARSGRPGRPTSGRRTHRPGSSRNGARSGRPGRPRQRAGADRRHHPAAMEPGQEDREDQADPVRGPLADAAAMEPGQEDREDSFEDVLARAVLVGRNGARSGRPGRRGSSVTSCSGGGAAMEPGQEDREDRLHRGRPFLGQ